MPRSLRLAMRMVMVLACIALACCGGTAVAATNAGAANRQAQKSRFELVPLDSQLTGLPAGPEARPLALAAADFDEDGIADLVVGCAGRAGSAGAVTLLRGNIFAIYPNLDSGKRSEARSQQPFLGPGLTIELPIWPELLAAGDLDGDGHRDLVATRRGGSALWLLSGDGAGGLTLQAPITLPGQVVTMAMGELGRCEKERVSGFTTSHLDLDQVVNL